MWTINVLKILFIEKTESTSSLELKFSDLWLFKFAMEAKLLTAHEHSLQLISGS